MLGLIARKLEPLGHIDARLREHFFCDYLIIHEQRCDIAIRTCLRRLLHIFNTTVSRQSQDVIVRVNWLYDNTAFKRLFDEQLC